MAFNNNIDVHADFFTPQEFPVEILKIAKAQDVIPCCLNFSAKQFLAFMLFKEYYFLHNGISVFIQDPTDNDDLDHNLVEIFKEECNKQVPSGEQQGKRLTGSGPPQCHIPLENLSNMAIIRLKDLPDETDPKYENCLKKENEALDRIPIPASIFCSRKKFLELITEKKIPLDKLVLVVCDNVHEALRDDCTKDKLVRTLAIIRKCNKERSKESQPIRMVFLTVSLLHFYGNESDGFWRMGETFRKLERLCGAKVDTSSDVVALLRYSPPLAERIIPLNPTFLEESAVKLSLEIKNVLTVLKAFLESHVFDPVAAFGYDPNAPREIVEVIEGEAEEDVNDTDSIADELQKINHPNYEPLQIIKQFETILEKFGPWCAERSLVLLLQLVDRLKVRTPYERHYLLLGALQTRLIVLQAAFCKAFYNMDPLIVLEQFSTPKLKSLLYILRRFNLTSPIESYKSRRTIVVLDEDDDDKNMDDEDTESFETKPPVVKTCRERRRKNVRNSRGKRKNVEIVETGKEPNEEGVTATPEDSDIVESVNQTGSESVKNGEGSTEVQDPSSSDLKDKASGRNNRRQRKDKHTARLNEPPLCGIVFVENRFEARLLFHFLKEASRVDPRLIGLGPTLAISSNPEYAKDSREAEMEHKKREDNLRKFRYREANLLVGTSIIEDGIELPKANLVVRFDSPASFRSYFFSKGRAQGRDAEFYIFADESGLPLCLRQLTMYKLVQEMLLTHSIMPHMTSSNSPLDKQLDDKFPRFKSASLITSISIVNRYCARLPSDTFTRLVPLWTMQEVDSGTGPKKYSCTMRLPINSPVKWPIKGIPMPTEDLAKKVVALQTAIVLHKNGELDENLLPIGKEGVTAEPDLNVVGDQNDEEIYGEFRPGSTKRRQYYDKKLADELVHCIPKAKGPIYLYWIQMVLTCPLPDEQNTRGRKLHPPELCMQSFGIILSKEIELVPSFPIYTRCGEVEVKLVHVVNFNSSKLTEESLNKISTFHHYTFTSVLRLDKYLTLFDPDLSENSYYVVPLQSVEFDRDLDGIVDLSSRVVDIDWKFLDRIWENKNCIRPLPKSDDERKDYEFRREDYEDAVVMPWYRSHDAPQYFYVAEICNNLTPKSQFPGCEFKTFHEYYQKKYNIGIQCVDQPLLDVDHTSARLNFLTPRYVNRKGMALPTSSENTKKAKRENLEQKQILVPELCTIHPFTASFWRQAVSLPCILYRINSLLLSNNIRVVVASGMCGLGKVQIPTGFKWEPLSFGWSLSDIFPSTSGQLKIEYPSGGPADKNGDDHIPKEFGEVSDQEDVDDPGLLGEEKGSPPTCKPDDPSEDEEELTGFAKAAKEPMSAGVSLAEALLMNKHLGKSANEILRDEMKKCKQPTLEIGTWSNDMASDVEPPPENEEEEEEDELLDPNVAFPSNLVMLDKNWTWGGKSRLFNHRVHRALYGSPTHWGEVVWDSEAFIPVEDLEDPANHYGIDNDAASVASDLSGSDASFLDEENSVKIQFHSGNTAEALDKRKFWSEQRQEDLWTATEDLWWKMDGIDEQENEDVISSKPVNDDDVQKEECDVPEEKLKEEFEYQVKNRICEIKDIVPWESIPELPSRQQGEEDSTPDSSELTPEIDFEYETLLNDLTPINPPPLYPASNGFFKDLQQSSNLDKHGSFSFDYQPDLYSHYGPNPCLILQALTMSNANDGLNLERLETIGDSFLKYAITAYLFCTYDHIHEGKLSHLRSKQVSNVHLYRLGRRRGLGKLMIATKFEPHDNWLPPAYHIPKDLDKALILSKLPPSHVSMAQVTALKGMTPEEMESALKNHSVKSEAEFVPYNLVTQQSIPDKSIADCVEALIGAYLTSMGPQGALLFMSWLGMRVLPSEVISFTDVQARTKQCNSDLETPIFVKIPASDDVIVFGNLKPPKSPLLRFSSSCEKQLEILLKGYDEFENLIGYTFRDRSYLLQAFTHASYSSNYLTDCYQRLEFLGDAILDYLITRHLYEDPRQHSPGSLTDLRSALVNNTIFASLAVKNNFHKYFRHSSPGLGAVLQRFVTFQEQHGNTLTQDYYLMDEEECEEVEDIEVPKALGDVFESVAGAIFLDSGMSLDAVWKVYFSIMKEEIEAFSKNVPKSPIRELLELEPETAKFGKPEKLWDGRRVRVTVEIFGVGVFRGIGRNYRIAKCTAAKCALRHVRKIRQTQARRH